MEVLISCKQCAVVSYTCGCYLEINGACLHSVGYADIPQLSSGNVVLSLEVDERKRIQVFLNHLKSLRITQAMKNLLKNHPD